MNDLTILAQIRRLTDSGWTPEQYTVADHQSLPKRGTDNATKFAAARLRKLPTNPDQHVGLQLLSRGDTTGGHRDTCSGCGWTDEADAQPLPNAPPAVWMWVDEDDDDGRATFGYCDKCFADKAHVDPAEEPTRWRNVDTGEERVEMSRTRPCQRCGRPTPAGDRRVCAACLDDLHRTAHTTDPRSST